MDSKLNSGTEMSTKEPTDSEDEEEEEDETYYKSVNVSDLVNIVKIFLDNFISYSQLISEKGRSLQCCLVELASSDGNKNIHNRIKAVEEAADVFRVVTNAMINTCDTYLELTQQLINKWNRILEHERNRTNELEFIVQQLKDQHFNINGPDNKYHCTRKVSNLSTSISGNCKDSKLYQVSVEDPENNTCTTDEKHLLPDKYGKILEETDKSLIEKYAHFDLNKYSPITLDKSSAKYKGNLLEQNTYMVYDLIQVTNEQRSNTETSTTRRKRVPDRPNHSLNLWTIMKNCIGKDLSKIPMPVNFSEPLSMLQRLVETFEYSSILDHAVQCTDFYEQMAYVAAFTISNYSTTVQRVAKPFNPLLGETYEWDRREDLGWRVICEQVSHHPPIAALYCEADQWTCWQEFRMSSKFRGKYLQVIPLGTVHLKFRATGHHYSWNKVITTVHNIIVGKLWVDQHGEMDIINHTNGIKCHLSYVPYGYFSRESQRRVKGIVSSKEGEAKWLVNGTWDSQVEISPIKSIQGTPNNPVFETGENIVAWTVVPPPEDCEKYYYFTIFACQLNEMEEGVAPTDSRNRPDQRLMENGLWTEANQVKVKLEEKQRAARKKRSEAEAAAEAATAELSKDSFRDADQQTVSFNLEHKKDEEALFNDIAGPSNQGEMDNPTTSALISESDISYDNYPDNIHTSYQPTWFAKKFDLSTNTDTYVYKGGYWEAKEKQDWSMCPDIYL